MPLRATVVAVGVALALAQTPTPTPPGDDLTVLTPPGLRRPRLAMPGYSVRYRFTLERSRDGIRCSLPDPSAPSSVRSFLPMAFIPSKYASLQK